MAMFQGSPYEPLGSEKVVVEAPLSFAGSTKRLLRLSQSWNDIVRLGVLILVLPMVWILIACWYLFWGIWLVPYRLLRRGSRKRKRQALQHREMLTQMQYQAMSTQAALAAQQSTPPSIDKGPTAG